MSVPSPASDPHPTPPSWARFLDLLCLLLMAIAAIVAGWGGFRERVNGIRVALTSPYRVLAAAVVLAAVRHAIVPRPAIVQDLPRRIRAAWGTPASAIARLAFLGTRPTILLIGYFAVVTLGYSNNGRPPLRFTDNEFLNLQGKWDTAWYMSVVTDGYRYKTHDVNEQQNIVFFPALPIAVRVIGRFFGGSAPAFLWGGTIIVLAAFFWSLIYVYRLAREFIADEEAARWAVWVTATYPFAVYFSALYTESFFLLGAAGAIYHFRRRELIKAALWGLLVGLTRPNGAFLSIPLGLMAIAPWLPRWVKGGYDGVDDRLPSSRHAGSTFVSLVAAAAPGVGVLIYSAFIWQLTGDPLAWAEGHAAWGRQYNGLLPLAVKYYGYMAESGPYIFTKVLPFDTLNGLGALFVIFTAFPVWRRYGLPYAVFILINILPPLAAGGFFSTGRFSAVLFPAFLWFASVVPPRHRPAWTGSFMAVQALNAALFYTWHEMF
jgi:mannosyltransferase PIG-V